MPEVAALLLRMLVSPPAMDAVKTDARIGTIAHQRNRLTLMDGWVAGIPFIFGLAEERSLIFS